MARACARYTGAYELCECPLTHWARGFDAINVPATAGDDEAASRPRIVVVQNWHEELTRLMPVK